MRVVWLKVVLPFALIAICGIGAYAMYLSRPEPPTRIPETSAPLVRVQPVELQKLRLSVMSQGTVSPRTESVLVPEVAGRVIGVAPSFESGGFFERDDVLLRIDSFDYEEAVVQARAAVAQAELRRALEVAEAEVAREEWAELGEGDAPPLTARVPQLAQAEAAVDAARSALQRAERNLARTEIRAPYAGRVRTKQVDIGQYVTPGIPLATIYAVDIAEIRLPLPDAQLAYVDVPLDYRDDGADPERGPSVLLRAEFAGRTHEWTGRIVRTEGEIDRRSRMVHLVAQVRDPYARGDEPDRPPLAAGMFVQAEILGRQVSGVAVLPRSAMRPGNVVLVVDDEGRLRFRKVDVLRIGESEVIIRGGLEQGERICLSPLAAVTDGMRVRTADVKAGI